MPHLVRENLFIGNITDAVDILENGSATVTHILSVLSSASISFFSEYKKGLAIPTKEINTVYADGGDGSSGGGKVVYLVEYAGKDLKLVRMGVPIRDIESENLLDSLEWLVGLAMQVNYDSKGELCFEMPLSNLL